MKAAVVLRAALEEADEGGGIGEAVESAGAGEGGFGGGRGGGDDDAFGGEGGFFGRIADVGGAGLPGDDEGGRMGRGRGGEC